MLTRKIRQNIQNAGTQEGGSLKLNGRVGGAMFNEVEHGADQTAELEDTNGNHIWCHGKSEYRPPNELLSQNIFA